jgi:predicted nucleic acid-binding Zn ribbon protein
MDDLTFNCPVCGADVPRRAKACPQCGACEKSGWSEDRYLDGLDLPDEGTGYRKFAALECGRRPKQTPKQRLWLIVAIIVIIAMVWLSLRGLW